MEIALIRLITSTAIIGAILVGGVVGIRMRSQRVADNIRKRYKIEVDRDVSLSDLGAWLQAMYGLPVAKHFLPMHCIQLDTYRHSDKTIEHYISVPSHLRGDVEILAQTGLKARLEPVEDADEQWDYAVELVMENPSYPLRMREPAKVNEAMLSAFQQVPEGSAMVQSWVFVPHQTAPGEDDPPEVVKKLKEATFLAAGRLAARGPNAERLVRRMYGNLASTNDVARFKALRLYCSGHYTKRVNAGHTRLKMPMLMSIPEFAPILGLAAESPNNYALPAARSRHLPIDNRMPKNGGIILGKSNFTGAPQRDVIVPAKAFNTHAFIAGGSGKGKTTLKHQIEYQVMDQGYGLTVLSIIEDDFRAQINRVPAHRKEDVVIIDFMEEEYPAGMDLLYGSNKWDVAESVYAGIANEYPELGKLAQTSELLVYSLFLLASNGLAITEIRDILAPEHSALRARLVDNLDDPTAIDYWNNRYQDGFKDDKAKLQAASPILRRLSPILRQPRFRGVLGQPYRTDGPGFSFTFEWAFANNKIVFIRLPPKMGASRVGESDPAAWVSTLVMLMFGAAVSDRLRVPEAERSLHFLSVDELSLFKNSAGSFMWTLRQARKSGIGFITAFQDIGDDGISKPMFNALAGNADQKIVLGASSKDALELSREMPGTRAEDFVNLSGYEAIGSFSVGGARMAAVTFKMEPPLPFTGSADEVIAESRRKYGKPAAVVEAERKQRLKVTRQKKTPPPIGDVPVAEEPFDDNSEVEDEL